MLSRLLSSRLSSYAVYLMLSAATAFSFTVFGTLSSVYRLQTAGLSPFQLVLIGTVLELSVFIFEVPTGIVADLYSRRRSVVIGMFLIGAGFVLEGLVPVFTVMLFAQVVWGVVTSGSAALPSAFQNTANRRRAPFIGAYRLCKPLDLKMKDRYSMV